MDRQVGKLGAAVRKGAVLGVEAATGVVYYGEGAFLKIGLGLRLPLMNSRCHFVVLALSAAVATQFV